MSCKLFLVASDELKVEYPVVAVISVCPDEEYIPANNTVPVDVNPVNDGALDCDTMFCNSNVPFAVILAAVIVPVNVGDADITTLPVPVIAFDTNPSLALVKTA